MSLVGPLLRRSIATSLKKATATLAQPADA